MRLDQQARLVFAEGRSEKVYEVDLCEVGPGRYVVNFRYGKRGAPLKEGTRTEAPVALAEATRAFDRLVESKLEQGYRPDTGAHAAPRPAPAPPAPAAA
ncbi:MAG TPA: WGR domain-containing protein, partial [Polyangiaceae bacterium]|nr:WGR domain-containing protein [Polyangiaceae bacterium]